MIAETIKLVLSNLPVLLCVVATICPTFLSRDLPLAQRCLSWILLLAVGIDGLRAGIFHVFFPGIASAQIGWQPSPFEFEIGIAAIVRAAFGDLS